VTDLSAPERLIIGGIGIPMLAIAMGASMLVQQWMTPATGDPMQRRMMLLMPVMFTFMFINFPSGLVLYWLVNNLLTIAQQYVLVNKPQSKGREPEDSKGLGKSLLAIAQQHGLVKKPRGNNREKRHGNRRGGGTHDR
jgi:membrane protein insertase Oxa1/YidC/SpoIIIJ